MVTICLGAISYIYRVGQDSLAQKWRHSVAVYSAKYGCIQTLKWCHAWGSNSVSEKPDGSGIFSVCVQIFESFFFFQE